MPTPKEQNSHTTSTNKTRKAFGVSVNKRCASSKKNTSFGRSRSPTSGNCSNSSASSHNRKVEKSCGAVMSLSATRRLIMPRPSLPRRSRSWILSAGSPKKTSPPCSSSTSNWRCIELVGDEEVDLAAAVAAAAQQVVDIERGFAEEDIATLFLQHEQLPLYRAEARGRDVAVFLGEGLRIVAHVAQHRAQVFQIEQQQTLIIRHLEGEAQQSTLRVVEAEQPRQQQRSHLRDRGAERHACLAEYVPERDGVIANAVIAESQFFSALRDFWGVCADLGHAGEIALHVGEKDRHADVAQALRELLQCNGLACARGAADEAVTVRELRIQHDVVSA